MVERYKRKANGGYFPKKKIKFIPTGCTTLDCVLGGGWPLGRVVNIVGDRAVGKTLLAIEAAANFSRAYPKGHIWYREAEAAFDIDYAERLGLPSKKVDFGPEGEETIWDTVEDIFEDLDKCADAAIKSGQPGMYVIDSLDALSSREEMKRDIDKGSYKTDKAKLMSELFRRVIRKLHRAQILFIVISQVRDRIGITFGDKKTRSGGKALDFYATHILYLSNLGGFGQTVHGNKRQIGVRIRAKSKKNKVSVPFREAEFGIRFFYGVDDLEANVEWLKANGFISKAEAVSEIKIATKNFKRDYEAWKKQDRVLKQEVIDSWNEVEADFLPQHSKYN